MASPSPAGRAAKHGRRWRAGCPRCYHLPLLLILQYLCYYSLLSGYITATYYHYHY